MQTVATHMVALSVPVETDLQEMEHIVKVSSLYIISIILPHEVLPFILIVHNKVT